MSKQDFTPFLVIAGIGAAGYFLYSNGMLAQWFPSLFGVAASNPVLTSAPPVSTATNPANPPNALVPVACQPVSHTCSDGSVLTQTGAGSNCVIGPWNCPVVVTPGNSAALPLNMAQQLSQAIGMTSASSDQWCYAYQQVKGVACAAGSVVGASMTAQQFLDALAQYNATGQTQTPAGSAMSGLRGISSSRVPRLAIHRGYV